MKDNQTIRAAVKLARAAIKAEGNTVAGRINLVFAVFGGLALLVVTIGHGVLDWIEAVGEAARPAYKPHTTTTSGITMLVIYLVGVIVCMTIIMILDDSGKRAGS